MAGRGDGSNGGPPSNLPLFMPPRSHGRLSSLATSESTGTNSSQYSIPFKMGFENLKALTPISSESDWSNLPTDGGFVPVEQYRALQARFNEMHREHANLVKERLVLEAKNTVLKEAYDHLVERIPISLAEPITLKRENYPMVTYWYRHEYQSALADGKITSVDDAPLYPNEADDNDDEDGATVPEQSGGVVKGKRGKGRASQGQNVKMRYLQHENGDVIDGWRASDIRRFARSIFVGFALQGKLFHSWVEGVDAASRTCFYRDMVARFPELGLCELDWKSEQIASEIYSQWRSNWMNKKEAEKTKGKNPAKRSVDENLNNASQKKTKFLKPTGDSVTVESIPVDPLNSVPQVDGNAADAPGSSMQSTGETSSDRQIPLFLFANDQPQYQFSINKPFAAALSPFPLPSLPAVKPQDLLNPGQHPLDMHPRQAGPLPDATQKPSKRGNKMRANKHSVTPRNLCAKEWVEQYHGTVDEFAAYFSALPAQELERFKALSKSLSNEKDD
ncbi:hypothetical protein HYPSUDRAFT_200266 [Hypholoma sublateritium FD-334 SS-4]|uniref:Uncharacterized protein n=1 Tax=Hypholoma sublateritium (strain FD-334 SS-4) TaxID=945553 RepID=A0A0D2P7V5_HYPSF|nr:hypothetical protein HYPSUDRAFT_200266 [Hypholoma sublateritium FD-334 SS-4]